MRHRKTVALALAAVLLPLAGFAAEHVTAANLTLPGVMKVFAKGSSFVVAIPLTYVYDADGGRVAVISGYSAETKSKIAQALTKKAPEGAPRIDELITYLDRTDGSPMAPADLQSHAAVVAEFSAPWCAPCRSLKPEIASLAAESKTPVVVLDIDADMRRFSREKMQELPKQK